ncbi:UNVERIFIED_CONTAM: hypothetical protein Slati_2432300 [Sesamum latifolium]|uniref:Integrase catalytic domain-containing protein n=1 Tax=Sesamum latifolium TaxID=2727402 RepID=A0AAW2WCZ0_9LAMI
MDTNKFNGTNYNDWLMNLRIILDIENQGYILDKPLPTALPEGPSPEECLMFDKWLEDNRKICRDKSILRDQDGRMIVCAESWGQDAFPSGNTRGPVLERSRKLSKVEMILRLGDEKVVAAEAVGSLSLVVNICGPLNTPARGGYSYFITFTDDHSRYGYVYLMRYKSEAFGRFKKYRLEVENQTGHKIKALWSDRGGEYLHGEFIDYLKENGILSQWTPPGTPQLKEGYALETAAKLLNIAPSKTVPQKRVVGDKLDSRSSLCRFIGYLEETAGYYFYDPSEQKIFISRNAMFLEKGFSADSQRDEVFLEELSEESRHDNTTSLEHPVLIDSVPALRRSTRESRAPERYRFVG